MWTVPWHSLLAASSATPDSIHKMSNLRVTTLVSFEVTFLFYGYLYHKTGKYTLNCICLYIIANRRRTSRCLLETDGLITQYNTVKKNHNRKGEYEWTYEIRLKRVEENPQATTAKCEVQVCQFKAAFRRNLEYKIQVLSDANQLKR